MPDISDQIGPQPKQFCSKLSSTVVFDVVCQQF